MERTVAFVDLAGYTALTEAHGDLAAVDLLSRVTALTRSALDPGDVLVKTIGDGLMLSSLTPPAGLRLVRRLCERFCAEPELPLTHAGLHHGDVVERDGDLFGSVVNVAARVAAYAKPGRVLITAPVATAARASGLAVANVGKVRLHNIPYDVELFEVPQCAPVAVTTIDPVCRMRVDPALTAARLTIDGVEYAFCSVTCSEAFADSPETYR